MPTMQQTLQEMQPIQQILPTLQIQLFSLLHIVRLIVWIMFKSAKIFTIKIANYVPLPFLK